MKSVEPLRMTDFQRRIPDQGRSLRGRDSLLNIVADNYLDAIPGAILQLPQNRQQKDC
jgi:hypothetical protein